jgi:hypothetical protein
MGGLPHKLIRPKVDFWSPEIAAAQLHLKVIHFRMSVFATDSISHAYSQTLSVFQLPPELLDKDAVE